MQSRAGPTLPDKQEALLWNAGVMRLPRKCAEVVRTLLQARECIVRAWRDLQETIPWVKAPRLVHRHADVQALPAQGLTYMVSTVEGPWQGRSGPGLQDQ